MKIKTEGLGARLEYALGEKFILNDEEYECVANANCAGCAFHSDLKMCRLFRCAETLRGDKVSVCYHKVAPPRQVDIDSVLEFNAERDLVLHKGKLYKYKICKDKSEYETMCAQCAMPEHTANTCSICEHLDPPVGWFELADVAGAEPADGAKPVPLNAEQGKLPSMPELPEGAFIKDPPKDDEGLIKLDALPFGSVIMVDDDPYMVCYNRDCGDCGLNFSGCCGSFVNCNGYRMLQRVRMGEPLPIPEDRNNLHTSQRHVIGKLLDLDAYEPGDYVMIADTRYCVQPNPEDSCEDCDLEDDECECINCSQRYKLVRAFVQPMPRKNGEPHRDDRPRTSEYADGQRVEIHGKTYVCHHNEPNNSGEFCAKCAFDNDCCIDEVGCCWFDAWFEEVKDTSKKKKAGKPPVCKFPDGSYDLNALQYRGEPPLVFQVGMRLAYNGKMYRVVENKSEAWDCDQCALRELCGQTHNHSWSCQAAMYIAPDEPEEKTGKCKGKCKGCTACSLPKIAWQKDLPDLEKLAEEHTEADSIEFNVGDEVMYQGMKLKVVAGAVCSECFFEGETEEHDRICGKVNCLCDKDFHFEEVTY